jgi:aminoglycoside N3'-acetyltransferase
MNQRACSEKIAADLKALGILPGHTVLAHASFKALGPVPGEIETVIQGFLQAIGPEGTLLMPALRAYPKTHWNHDGLSFRAGQGGCSGGNTQGGLSPEQTTPPDAKRHATRCGHGISLSRFRRTRRVEINKDADEKKRLAPPAGVEPAFPG